MSKDIMYKKIIKIPMKKSLRMQHRSMIFFGRLVGLAVVTK